MRRTHPSRNARLTEILDELGWSVARLAREINREIGQAYVSRNTASEWLSISRIPRQPLPTVIAHVLSQACRREIAVPQLWSGISVASEWVSADAGTYVPWNLWGTASLAHDWFINGENTTDADRRSFMAMSGTALTLPVWGYVEKMSLPPKEDDLASLCVKRISGKPKLPSSIVGLLHATVAYLRRMDDVEGGGSHVLSIVHGELRKVAGYLDRGSFERPQIASSVLGVFGQLAQLAGWVAYDAEKHGLAQRYFRTALQASHACDDRELGAHVLGWMACHAAYRGRVTEAVEIAGAAVTAAAIGHPVVQSLAHVRLAYAYAAAANLSGFRGAIHRAREQWARAPESEPPSFLYWYNADYIDILCGEGLQMLALRSARNYVSLLREADLLLLDKIDRHRETMPRDSLFHSVWQARGYVRLGDAEAACAVTRKVLHSMHGVSSPRIISTLHRLDRDLAARRILNDIREVKELRREVQLVGT